MTAQKKLFKRKITALILALLATALLIGASWSFYSSSINAYNNNNSISADKATYITVVPFKNNTGKDIWEPIGEMASDWIISGLHETGEGTIISVKEDSQQTELAGMTNEISRHTAKEEVATHYIVEGNYYVLDEKMIFSATVKDLTSGEIVFTVPIQGKVDSPMESIALLKERILGFWVTKDQVGYEKRPPDYEAYKAYLQGGKLWYLNPRKAHDLMKKAIELDSNFHYAAFSYTHKLISFGQHAKADSVIANYNDRKEQLTPMELEFLRGLKARLTKKSGTVVETLEFSLHASILGAKPHTQTKIGFTIMVF